MSSPSQIQKFTLSCNSFSLNQYRTTHFYALNKLKKEYATAFFYQLKLQKIRNIKTPCAMQVFFNWKNQNYDLDNQVVVKFLLDVLQNQTKVNKIGLGVLPNDNSKHIIKLCYCAGMRKDNTIDLIIHEL